MTRIDSSPSRNTRTAMSTTRAVALSADEGFGEPPAVMTAMAASRAMIAAEAMSATIQRPLARFTGGGCFADRDGFVSVRPMSTDNLAPSISAALGLQLIRQAVLSKRVVHRAIPCKRST